MGRLPGFLMRRLGRDVAVEPYRGWGDFAPARTVRMLVDEQLNTATANPGVQQLAQLSLLAPIGTDCPAGSRLTLPDGRAGYCNGSVARDYHGLPVPDHVQIALTLSAAFGPAFGETVEVLSVRRSRDAAGSVRHSVTATAVPGAAVRSLGSVESTDQQGRDTIVDSIEVILPPDTDVGPLDRLRVRGLVFDVDASPTPAADATTTARPGVRVVGKRSRDI
jgi:hypothetical protein